MTSASYDANHNKVTEIDPAGNVTTWTYNGRNDLASESVSDSTGSHTSVWSYNPNGTLRLAHTAPQRDAERVTAYDYGDPSHPFDVTEVTDPEGQGSALHLLPRGLRLEPLRRRRLPLR